LLCVAGAANIFAWSLSAAALGSRQAVMPARLYRMRRLQLILSAIYVSGCAFRCAFPVYDVPRICLFDHWWSGVLVGRSVATAAELCFVAQWALLLNEISRATRSAVGTVTSLAVVPLIAIAEICSWYSVLTTSNLGHVAEESIWALCAGDRSALRPPPPTHAARLVRRRRGLRRLHVLGGRPHVLVAVAGR
jgi:hypothetical protein